MCISTMQTRRRQLLPKGFFGIPPEEDLVKIKALNGVPRHTLLFVIQKDVHLSGSRLTFHNPLCYKQTYCAKNTGKSQGRCARNLSSRAFEQ
jgi:hypothetical protein